MQLHKSPVGLLDLFRLRTLGKNPSEFGEAVQPVADAQNYYGVDIQVVANNQSAPQAYPFAGTDSQTFAGRVFALSGHVVIGAAAGTRLQMQLGYRPTPQFQTIWLAEDVVTAGLVAGGTYFLTYTFPSPVVFPPGAAFMFSAQSDAAGADHVFVRRAFFENYSV